MGELGLEGRSCAVAGLALRWHHLSLVDEQVSRPVEDGLCTSHASGRGVQTTCRGEAALSPRFIAQGSGVTVVISSGQSASGSRIGDGFQVHDVTR